MIEARPGVLRTRKDQRWKDDHVWFNEVEKGGTYSITDLYMFLYQWFRKEYWSHWQSGDDRIEDFYLHRIRQDGVQENLIWWRAVRKINKYVYYYAQVDWQNFGSRPTEVLHEGKKVKADKAGITFRMWWYVQYDPYNAWEKSVLGRIQKWFFKYLLSTEQEEHRDKCRVIARRFENELKQFWGMTTDIPMPRSFFPEDGYKYKKQKANPDDYAQFPKHGDQRVV